MVAKVQIESAEHPHVVTEPEAGQEDRLAVQIAGLDLSFHGFILHDRTPTGRQIAEAFTAANPDEMVVLQWLSGAALEVVELDETVNLHAVHGEARFIVAPSDRLFLLEIDAKRLEWPAGVITGLTVKKLGRVEAALFDVFLERQSEPDREIGDDDAVNLTASGIERFRLKRREREVEIIVNEKPVLIEKGERTGLEIKEAAIKAGLPIKTDFLLSLDKPDGTSDTILNTDKVKVHKGQQFTAVADDDNS